MTVTLMLWSHGGNAPDELMWSGRFDKESPHVVAGEVEVDSGWQLFEIPLGEMPPVDTARVVIRPHDRGELHIDAIEIR